jgi:heme exporter protein CcmD
MNFEADHVAYIVASYGVSLAVIAVLVIVVVALDRKRAKALKRLQP